MKWREIFEELKHERKVIISYEAALSVELDSFIGDIPVYKFRVEYLTEGVAGPVIEYKKTFDELLDLIDREIVFRRCSRCGELITGGFYSNEELNEEYCGVACMTHAMNEQYGKGNWRFIAESEPIIEDEDGNFEVNEYQFEIYTDKVSLEALRYMIENFALEADEMKKEESGTVIELVRKMWVPYKMHCNPALFE